MKVRIPLSIEELEIIQKGIYALAANGGEFTHAMELLLEKSRQGSTQLQVAELDRAGLLLGK